MLGLAPECEFISRSTTMELRGRLHWHFIPHVASDWGQIYSAFKPAATTQPGASLFQHVGRRGRGEGHIPKYWNTPKMKGVISF